MLAPVVIFCYDRPNELKRMINTLKKNKEASETDVYVFCDGPKTPQNKQKNDEVRFFLQSLKGFKSLNLSISENNKGLAPSIIAGVSEVLKVHDQVIVLEDDLLYFELEGYFGIIMLIEGFEDLMLILLGFLLVLLLLLSFFFYLYI